MQPTVHSLTRLKRIAWLMGLLLVAVAGGAGIYINQLHNEARARAAVIEAMRQEVAGLRQSMEETASEQKAADSKLRDAEAARREVEQQLKAAETVKAELVAKLKAAEAAKAEAEAKLKAAGEKEQ